MNHFISKILLLKCVAICSVFWRGEYYEVLPKIGKIHSFIPPTVHIMYLTAIFTVELRKKMKVMLA